MRARVAAGGLLLALLGTPRASAAAEPPNGERAPVMLTLGPCPGVDASEVRRILPIELDTALVDVADATTLGVTVRCDGERALLRVSAAIDGADAPLERSLDLASTPAVGRARCMVLAIAELVAQIAPRPKVAPLPAVPAPSPVVAPPSVRDEVMPVPSAPPAAPPPLPAWTVEGLVHERSSIAVALSAWGGGARVSYALSPQTEWALDARGDHGAIVASLGTVGVTTASLGATFGVRYPLGALLLRGAAGLRLGATSLAGDPSNTASAHGASFVALWAGPCVDAGAELALTSWLVFGLAGEVGVDLAPTRGLVNGASEVSTGGAWLGARASLGVRF
jgi:hypothetical protein